MRIHAFNFTNNERGFENAVMDFILTQLRSQNHVVSLSTPSLAEDLANFSINTLDNVEFVLIMGHGGELRVGVHSIVFIPRDTRLPISVTEILPQLILAILTIPLFLIVCDGMSPDSLVSLKGRNNFIISSFMPISGPEAMAIVPSFICDLNGNVINRANIDHALQVAIAAWSRAAANHNVSRWRVE